MENTKRNPIFIIALVLTLIMTVFALYSTVFDQIISQSQGFFYAGVFGFILLLVFLLCNLFTKLIATSSKAQSNTAWKIAAFAILLVMGAVFLYSRISCTNEFDVTQSNIYQTYSAIEEGSYNVNDTLLTSDFHNPTQYIYALILSVFFNIFDDASKVFIVVNSILYVVSALCLYRITLRIADRICALFAVGISAILPAINFSVFSYDADALFTLIIMAVINLYTALFNYRRNDSDADKESDSSGPGGYVIVTTVFSCILTGLLFFCEPVTVIPVVLIIIFAFLNRRPKAFNLLIALLSGIVIFAGLSFAKSIAVEDSFGNVIAQEITGNFNLKHDDITDSDMSFSEVFSNFGQELSSTEDPVNDNYRFIYNNRGEALYTDFNISMVYVFNELVYMFLLVMVLSCLLIAYKESLENIMPVCLFTFGMAVILLFEQNRIVLKSPYLGMLCIFTGISLHYLYLNHHPEQKVSFSALDAIGRTARVEVKDTAEDTQANNLLNEIDFEKRARALIFVGTDEALYSQIKNEEHKKAMNQDHKRAIDDTFDDYDEDFFLDSSEGQNEADSVSSSDNGHISKVQPAKEPFKTDLPAWKREPEKSAGDDMYFDEEDEADKPSAPAKVPTGSKASDAKDAINNVPLPSYKDTSPDTDDIIKSYSEDNDSIELPKTLSVQEVTKNSSKAPGNKKLKKDKGSKKNGKQASSPAVSTVNNGTVVRKVKTVGMSSSVSDEAAIAAYMKSREDKHIPNPLPLPEKKEHKPIDYKVGGNSSSGWDYDYEISEDDDWDV